MARGTQTRTRVYYLLSILFLAIAMPAALQAGIMKVWQLKETADAPVLVVGRVLSVQKISRVPAWKDETWSMTAAIQVLRSYTSSGQTIAVDHTQVQFLKYGPSVTMFVNGNPPPFPHFEPGQVVILPLRENHNVHDPWQLVADSGVDLIIPARGDIPNSLPLPANARAFLDHEIANALSDGTPQEISAIAEYLALQTEDPTTELMPLLEPRIGDDSRRWAEVGTNLLAAQGIPRPSVANLISASVQPKDWRLRGSLFLAQAVLHKLKASPETDALLIATLISEVPLHAWGSANSLLEFADNPTTIETLRQALQQDVSGSSYIAWTLAHTGHRDNLPEALTRALKVADRPHADPSDLQGAAALLRDFGSDQQLKQLAALVQKYQTQDRNFYSSLWQYATEAGNPRETRVLAVVLHDRRPVPSSELRVCDFATGVLERAVNQHFGSGGKTLQERDAAVSRASAWLKSQGLAD